MKYSTVIVAAGNSERFAGNGNKLLYKFGDGLTVLDYALIPFENDDDCTQIIVVTNNETYQYLTSRKGSRKEEYAQGGASRSESALAGIKLAKEEIVMIHDGCRCFMAKEDLESLKKAMEEEDAALLVGNVVDTIKQIDGDYVVSTIDRDTLKRAQTPQAFKTEQILDAYDKAFKEGFTSTDDC